MTHHTAEPPRPAGVRGWLLKDLPYAAMLGLAVGGIVLTSFRGVSTHYYWMAGADLRIDQHHFGMAQGRHRA